MPAGTRRGRSESPRAVPGGQAPPCHDVTIIIPSHGGYLVLGGRSVCRPFSQLPAPPRAMRTGPPFVRPPKPLEPPAPRTWSMDAAGRSWDVFGHGRSAWSRGEEAAWDCFGFHIWPRWNGSPVEVFRLSSAGRRLSWALSKGVCTHIAGSVDPYVMMRTAPRCLRIAGFGVELVCSVRAMKHWVSRWRRGLRGLRRQNESMLLAHKLPKLPALVFHVQSFL